MQADKQNIHININKSNETDAEVDYYVYFK